MEGRALAGWIVRLGKGTKNRGRKRKEYLIPKGNRRNLFGDKSRTPISSSRLREESSGKESIMGHGWSKTSQIFALPKVGEKRLHPYRKVNKTEWAQQEHWNYARLIMVTSFVDFP